MVGDPDDIEWLDAEPPPNPPAGPHRPRRAWYLLLGAAAVAVVLVLTLTGHQGKRAAAPTRTPTPTPSSSVQIFLPEPSVAPTPPVSVSVSVSVTNLGHPLLHVPASWQLFAYGGSAMYRIELAKGRITRASAPISSGGPSSLVVGPHEVIVRPWDNVGGYLIRDGRPARDLTGLLAHGGPALPGPQPDQVWVQRGRRMMLVGLNGRPTGVSVPGQDYGARSDGAGYPMVRAVGGVYDARPDGLHRITTGQVLATGPTGYLAEECDDRHRCTLDVIDRASGAHHVLGRARDDRYSDGVISPDGRLAAVATQVSDPDQNAVLLHLIDLRSGADRAAHVTLSGNYDAGDALAWSPDSRWMFVADATGHILALDRAGHVKMLQTQLPSIEQLALRG